MAKRLVKIAKELNVGTTTIVDHLTKNGFEVENKPTAKITDEMYNELLKEFQKSIAIKEQADQLVIGNRPAGKGAPKEETTNTPTPPPNTTPTPDQNKAAEPEQKEEPKEEESSKKILQKPKILGKINLGKRFGKKEEPKKEEQPAQPEEKAAPTPPAAKKQEEPKEPTPPKQEVKKEEPKPEAKQVPEKPKPEVPKEEKKPEPKPVEQPQAEQKQPKPEAKQAPEKPKSEVPKEEKKQDLPKAKEEKKEDAPKKVEPKAEPKESKEVKQVKEEQPTSNNSKGEEQQKAPQALKQNTNEQQSSTSNEKQEKATPPSSKSKSKPIKDTPVVDKPEKKSSDKDKSDGKEDVLRTKAPELRGLKIQGKIDIEKFKKPKKKKKAADDKKGADAQSDKSKANSSSSGSSDQPKKRRRKRRKVSSDGNNQQQQQGQSSRPGDSGSRGGRGGNRNDRRGNRRNDRNRKSNEPQEVSQKEIEEKIKATMARLQGGGKKKRQKIRRDNRERQRERQELIEQEQKQNEKLQLTEFISVQELANLMDVPVTDVIMTCMNLGVIVSINQRLDAEIIELVAEEFDHEIEFITAEEQDTEEEEEVDDPEDLEPRAPIVTVMGHVDHGKTSLLDFIRSATVAEGEAGGITQHIGAYEIRVGENKKKITFLDTPGHEAFTAMRARGAKVTDIAVIIIAADDNVMPQTKEAISHAQAAGVPMVFAINKVDKPGAQPDRILQELANMNLLVESWGGQYQSQNISAKTGDGIDELLEKILLEAELLELQANPDRMASGAVIEASLDKGRGYVTKMLVQNGTLTIGAPVVAGEHSGKVKAMFNEHGKRIKKAGPSAPVLVLGLSGAPQAGERFKEVENEQEARQIAAKRGQIAREQTNRATKRISLDEIGRRLALGNFKELNLIVKGDVDGSVEALSDSLIKQSIESVQVNVIHKAVGQIIESDVLLASASDAIVIGFQVRPSMGARKLAEQEGVEIKTYSIIYEAIEEIRAAIEGLLEPTKEEKIIAQVEVRETYKISKVGTIAGCYVQEGKINRNSSIRLIRNGIVVFPIKEGAVGEIASLKRFKDDVREVKSGMECGISIKNFNDIKVGDIVEAYEIIEIKQTLD